MARWSTTGQVYKAARHGAFTLMELLVCLAIISVLAGLVFPVVARAREKARQTGCLSNVRQIAAGILLYVQDYDETFPAATNISAGVNSQFPHLRSLIQPFVRSDDVWWCPSEPRPSVWEKVIHPVPAFNDAAFRGSGTSYAYKSRNAQNPPGNRNGNLAGTPLAALTTPAAVWLFWDADSDYSRHTDGTTNNFIWGACRWRGMPGQMAAFADGHARVIRGIPYPQFWENMGLDGAGGIAAPATGCPPNAVL